MSPPQKPMPSSAIGVRRPSPRPLNQPSRNEPTQLTRIVPRGQPSVEQVPGHVAQRRPDRGAERDEQPGHRSPSSSSRTPAGRAGC